MNIYYLKIVKFGGWDSNDGFVIIASTAKEARKMANETHDCEGEIWEDKKLATCQKIGISTTRKTSQIVLKSFNAG